MAKANRNQQQNKGQSSKTRDNSNLALTAPYNFVPLSREVVRPKWTGQISHDKPFKDGQSGQLTLTIKAVQPIFTRNSVSRRVTNEDEKKAKGSRFSTAPDNRFFLPGSSVKGAIRNMLEVMSFGDLAKGLNDERYGMRDLYHEDYKAMFAINAKHKVHGGWLYESNGSYLLNDCGEPEKVPQSWIDEHFGTNHFRNFAEGRMQMSDEYKAAKKKYELFKNKSLRVNYGEAEGTLVFTGQPAANTKPKAKVNEFLFPTSSKVLNVPKQTINNFKLAYYDNDKNAQKPDYKFWSVKLRKGERVPVFFHKDDHGEVVSLGLAYMYKIPFTHSVKEAIQTYQKESGIGSDLAECIFGHVEKSNALRGRVIIGHAMASKGVQPLAEESEVLNSPKPTYYPTYIRQSVNNEGKVQGRYKTLFDKDAVPSGWKRYPIHSLGPQCNRSTNENLNTKFRPLPAGTTFTCTVNYHNLKKIELGALLSAFTFHQTPDCYHTLGMAKPLGYGKCTITVSGIDEALMQECLCAYEEYMEAQLKDKGGWLKSDQLRELLSMSSNQENKGRSKLVYMKEVTDFAKAKKDGLALDRYTKLEGVTPTPINQVAKGISKHTNQENDELNSREVFEQKKSELLDQLKQKRKALEAKEDQEKKAAEETAHLQKLEALAQRTAAATEASKESHRQAALVKGLNLSKVKANDKNIFNTIAKEIESYYRASGQAALQERDIEQVSGKLTEAAQRQNAAARKKWKEQPQYNWARIASFIPAAILEKIRQKIEESE